MDSYLSAVMDAVAAPLLTRDAMHAESVRSDQTTRMGL
jgi:hypothetical protein